jgi:lysyl-tRNA synthetase class I
MFQRPRQAKKLYFDVIPRAVDEYYQFLAAYPAAGLEGAARQSGLAHP